MAQADLAAVDVAAVAFVSPTSLGVLRQLSESAHPVRFEQLTKAVVPTTALEVVQLGKGHCHCYRQNRLAP